MTASQSDEPNDQFANDTNETTFEWGTVTTDRHPDTDALDVNVTVESEGSASVSAITASNASEHVREAEGDTEFDAFEWGGISHETDPDTGAVDVTVTVDGESDVSLSVTTIGENGSQSSSTTVISTASEGEKDGESGVDGASGGAGEAGQLGTDGESGTATTNVTIDQTAQSGAGLGESVGSIDVEGVSIDIDEGEKDEEVE